MSATMAVRSSRWASMPSMTSRPTGVMPNVSSSHALLAPTLQGAQLSAPLVQGALEGHLLVGSGGQALRDPALEVLAHEGVQVAQEWPSISWAGMGGRVHRPVQCRTSAQT
jgi:hypothetical protein